MPPAAGRGRGGFRGKYNPPAPTAGWKQTASSMNNSIEQLLDTSIAEHVQDVAADIQANTTDTTPPWTRLVISSAYEAMSQTWGAGASSCGQAAAGPPTEQEATAAFLARHTLWRNAAGAPAQQPAYGMPRHNSLDKGKDAVPPPPPEPDTRHQQRGNEPPGHAIKWMSFLSGLPESLQTLVSTMQSCCKEIANVKAKLPELFVQDAMSAEQLERILQRLCLTCAMAEPAFLRGGDMEAFAGQLLQDFLAERQASREAEGQASSEHEHGDRDELSCLMDFFMRRSFERWATESKSLEQQTLKQMTAASFADGQVPMYLDFMKDARCQFATSMYAARCHMTTLCNTLMWQLHTKQDQMYRQWVHECDAKLNTVQLEMQKIVATKDEYQKAMQERDNLQTQIDAQKQELLAIQQQVTGKQHVLADLQEQTRSMQTTLQSKQQDVAAATDELIRKQQDVAAANDELTRKQQAVAAATDDFAKQETQKQTAAAELEKTFAEIQTSANTLASKKRELDTVSADVQILTQQQETLKRQKTNQTIQVTAAPPPAPCMYIAGLLALEQAMLPTSNDNDK